MFSSRRHRRIGAASRLSRRARATRRFQPRGCLYGRATRALANYIENFAPFVAADLGLIATQHTGGLGPTIWILARIVYIPLYLLGGVPYARTAAWAVSIVGLLDDADAAGRDLNRRPACREGALRA